MAIDLTFSRFRVHCHISHSTSVVLRWVALRVVSDTNRGYRGSLFALRSKTARWVVFAGCTAIVVGGGLLLPSNQKTTALLSVTVFTIFRLGIGMVLTGTNIRISAASKPETRVSALVVSALTQRLGMSIGLN